MTITLVLIVLALLALFEFYRYRRWAAGTGSKCPFSVLFGNRSGKAKDSSGRDSTANEPGLGWQERYIGGSAQTEAAYIAQATRDIHLVQARNKKSSGAGSYKRAFHAKLQAGIVNARFVIAADLPEDLRLGMFQPGAEYPTVIRFSNASGTVKADTAKDLRGLACKIDTEYGVQDFLATNGSASHARDVRQFIAFALAMSGSKLLILPRLIASVGLLETVRMFRTVIKQGSRPVESLAKETYFSRSAYAIGDYAVAFRFVPHGCADASVDKSDDYLRLDLTERLKRGPVVFDFQIQLFRNEQSTPIEDGSLEWNTPLITIAQLVIPQQDLTSEEAHAARETVDGLAFTPWNLSEGVRPLGSQNRGRKPVYRASVALRNGEEDYKAEPWICRFMNGITGGLFKSAPAENRSPGGCPFGHGGGGNGTGETGGTGSGDTGNSGQTEGTGEILGDGGLWRPKSSREGIGPAKYVYWNMFYFVLQSLNRGLARDPNRKFSWDKWPPTIALLYLLAKIRFNRSNALTDPYDYAANDTKRYGREPEAAGRHIAADGTYVSDAENPQMGAENTRFGSNIPPRRIRPDIEEMTPSARDAGKLRWRRIDPETGREITIPAIILNAMAAWWIQFQFHGFGGNTKRDPVGVCPHMLKRRPEENWPDDVAVVDRTSADHTRVNDDGRPTPLNERVHAWIQGQLYGTNDGELNELRSFEGGKFRLDENGHLPYDPEKAGIDLTGFSQNYSPGLSFLHWLFVMDHNAICDHYAYFHPEWDDEELFQMARKVNVAQIARIHTIQWTEDLLQHPALQLGMHADWYGFLGQKRKMWLMRLIHRHPCIGRLLTPLRHSDTIWGMPGSKWEHHDGPFQVPKQFRLVYRLHELVLSENEIVEPGTDRSLERIDLLNFVHENTRPIVEKYGYEVLGWSFVRKSCGALTLHNFPRALTRFENQQDGTLTDLAERDIFRERTDGTGTYNEYRRSLGEPPVTSFMELTGGDAELAREIEIKYEGDIDAVDAGIGILAEPKPAGFALGITQFYQFVLNAPRRVKSNRYLTEGFTYADYQEGMDWVEHGGGMHGVMYRHLPALRPLLEGVTRVFSPWKETETFPTRQLEETHAVTAKVFKADLRTFVLAGITAALAVVTGHVSLPIAALLMTALAVVPVALAARRMLAMRFMQLVGKKCYSDKRFYFFGTLTRAEASIERAAFWGRVHGRSVVALAAVLSVCSFFGGAPLLGLLLGATAVSGMGTAKWSRLFARNAQVLKIALRNRMRAGQPRFEAAMLKGGTAKEKRAHFDNEVPDILMAGSEDHQDLSNCVYNDRGEVDLDAFERLFRTYAPGRDYMTAYDFERLNEAMVVQSGRGNVLTRFFALRKANKLSALLTRVFGDRVAEEDKELVPAVSKEMLLAFYLGTAQAQLRREREEGDRDPSPGA